MQPRKDAGLTERRDSSGRGYWIRRVKFQSCPVFV